MEKKSLFRLKTRALRSGVWFRTLRRIDRALVDLTLAVAGKVKSPALMKALLSVVAKLEDGLQRSVSRVTDQIGFQLACKLSRIAVYLGNSSAISWASDTEFARFLAVMHLNERCLAKS